MGAATWNNLQVTRAFGAIALGLALAALLFIGSVWRVERDRIWLSAVGAEFYWQHQVFDQKTMQVPVIQQKLAKYLASALVSNLAVVNINTGDLNDEQLRRLSGLQSLRSLRVVSHHATDQTIETISRIGNLRHLDLEGKQFSFKGLLKLRDLEHLRYLSLIEIQLTSAELAVLETALPNAEIIYQGPNRIGYYHRVPAIARKTAADSNSHAMQESNEILGS